MSHHPKPWQSGNHLVICDSCGAQRYRSQCDYTWDGYLMCHVLNCWYIKDPIHEIPPVVNDPQTLFDVRPDQTSGTETYVDEISGLLSTFQGPQFGRGTMNGRVTFDTYHEVFGSVDDPPNYANL